MSHSHTDQQPVHLDADDLPTQQLVEEINDRHGTQFSVRRRCAGGEQGGAWIVQEPDGPPLVLKWSIGADGPFRYRKAAEVNRIHAAGYPTPVWRLVGATREGACYDLQDFVPGEPATLTVETAMLMVEVIEKQTGLAPDLGRDWSEFMLTMALDDDDPDSPRRFVRRLGPHGQTLIEHYDAVLAIHGPVRLPRTDLVHGDFSTGNIMIHQGRISGMVDIGALGAGTRVVDYAWPIRESFATNADPGAADVLRRAAERVAGPGVLALCTTATVFDLARWTKMRTPEHLASFLDRMHLLADYLAQPQP
jgi:hypothetical protein